ncbi:MAG: hypothetical protein JWP48_2199 [Actinoallomurus sp.]|nr:hypothetical protein [Actinoallomurus sp.]
MVWGQPRAYGGEAWAGRRTADHSADRVLQEAELEFLTCGFYGVVRSVGVPQQAFFSETAAPDDVVVLLRAVVGVPLGAGGCVLVAMALAAARRMTWTIVASAGRSVWNPGILDGSYERLLMSAPCLTVPDSFTKAGSSLAGMLVERVFFAAFASFSKWVTIFCGSA